MEPKHTPEPWTVHEDPENPGSCTIYPEHGHPIGEEGAYFAPADARLIAAAPDLLKALETLLASFDSEIHNEYDGTSMLAERLAEADHARAAIAKARGTT